MARVLNDEREEGSHFKYLLRVSKQKQGRNVVYQTDHYTEEQLMKVRKDKIRLIFLFGDNEDDKYRKPYEKRHGLAGQASVAGNPSFENVICIGIVTVWNKCRGLKAKMDSWEQTFEELSAKVKKGWKIVVPSPSKQDFLAANYKFFGKNKQQVIFHSLGTGIADAPLTDLFVIQQFLDQLEEGVINRKKIDFNPLHNPLIQDKFDSGYSYFAQRQMNNLMNMNNPNMNDGRQPVIGMKESDIIALKRTVDEKEKHIQYLQSLVEHLKGLLTDALKGQSHNNQEAKVQRSLSPNGSKELSNNAQYLQQLPPRHSNVDFSKQSIIEQKVKDLATLVEKLTYENDQLKQENVKLKEYSPKINRENQRRYKT